MNKRLEWFLLLVLAAVGIFLWYKLSLPRYQSINLSVSQTQAVGIAKKFLTSDRQVNIKGYYVATTFNADDDADRYLQRTLGNAAYQDLIKRLHYDLFCWVIRFFKEKQKEEYKIVISSATGQVIGMSHTIDDTAARPLIDKGAARQIAVDFLKKSFGFDPSQYTVRGEDVHKYDNRVEYSFSWENKAVHIPWSKDKNSGYGKLLTSVVVSGHEILTFSKSYFEIPDGFNRYVDNLKQTGQNLTLIFRIFYLALMTISIVVVVNRKQQVVSRSVKSFYIGAGVILFIFMGLDILNSYQEFLFNYPTTQSLGDYTVRQLIEGVIGPFFIAVGFVLPAIGGESLRYEVCSDKKNQGFLTVILSSFFTRNIAQQILIAYTAAALILGVQAFIFNLGFKYCGVWDELSWLTQASTSLVPAFTAMAIGVQASFSEEAMFRLFAINLFKKYGLPTFLAVFLAAMMWGFGHTGYEIFPMWFRGVEVTCIGIIMGVFYLRYGLVCVIATHFLIDSFLSGLPYLLNPHLVADFYPALGVISLPLVLAVIALILNRDPQEKPLSIRFNPQQQFNFVLLQEVYRSKTPQQLPVLKKDLERHGWDAAIIKRVFGEEN